jgi:hypothetical protein
MQFLKIKKDKKTDKITLEYQKKKGDDSVDEFAFSSFDKPLPGFDLAMLALRKYVLQICEYPVNDDFLTRVTVTGVSFSYGGNEDVMGATLIAQLALKECNAPLNLNTPHLAEDFYSENGGSEKQLMPVNMASDLDKLIDEAERYLQGERAQGELFKTDTEKH